MKKPNSFVQRVLVYDECLRQTHRAWTKEELLKQVNYKLQSFDIEAVTIRTVTDDFSKMRRGAFLGKVMDIECYNIKYYRYANPNHALPNLYVSPDEKRALAHIKPLIDNLKGFQGSETLDQLILKSEMSPPSIETPVEFDNRQYVEGIDEHLSEVYQAILTQKALDIRYEAFDRAATTKKGFSPYRLKQNNYRWYVAGWCNHRFDVLGLERIKYIAVSNEEFVTNKGFDIDKYFSELVGVRLPHAGETEVEQVQLCFRGSCLPYVKSKKLHCSQRVITCTDSEYVIEFTVKLNHELETLILGYGQDVTVLKPQRLQKRIVERLMQTLQNY